MSQKTSSKRVLFPRIMAPARVGGFLASWHRYGVLLLLVVLTVVLGMGMLHSQKALAATNATLNFQARLEGSAGNIVADGNYNVQFKLYNVSSGGSALWTETYQNSNSQGVRVANGYLTVNLGSITAFPTSINWDQNLWITLNIGGTDTSATPAWDGEMNPRLALTGVPYAFRAGQLAQYNSSTGFTSTLSLLQPTVGNQTFQLADQGAAGTYTICVQNSTACGFAAATGGSGYIQNQNSLQQATSNFWISGTGRADTALQAPSFDTPTAVALNIGTTNATSITVGKSGVNTVIGGNLSVGTTQSLGAITIANGAWFTAVDSTGSGTVNMFEVNSNNQIQVGAALNVDGGIILPTDGGQMTLSDLPIDSTATSGTKESYTLRVGSANALTVYGEADGAGNAQNVRVAVGSSIAPGYTLDVGGDINTTSSSFYRLGGTAVLGGNTSTGLATYASNQPDIALRGQSATNSNFYLQSYNGAATTMFAGLSGTYAGNVGIGTTTPGYTLTVAGSVSSSSKYLVGNTAGVSTTCSGGQVLQNQVVLGGIVTGGSCATAGAGSYIQNGTTQQTANFNIAAASGVAAVIQGASGQDIAEFNNSSGSTAARVDYSGNFYGATLQGNNSVRALQAQTGSNALFVQGAANATAASAFIQAASGQTGDLLDLVASNGSTVLSSFDNSGNLTAPTIRANTAFNINGTTGASTTCSGGQFLQNQVVVGGIVTGGNCATASGGSGVTAIGTIDSQTKSTNGAVISGTTLYLQSADASNPGLLSTGAQTIAGVKTFQSTLTANGGLSVASGSALTNAGSTINTAVALSNFTANGAIGTAAATVDVATSFTVNQTTAGITLTVPSPTVTTAGRVIYIANIGTASFTVTASSASVIVSPNTAAIFLWNGTVWTSAGIDGSGTNYIQNQNASTQTGNFKISGTGVAGTLQAGTFDTASAGTLNIGSTNATTLNIATNAAAHTIAIGNGAAVQGITIGSTNSTSSLLLQGGTGNVQIQTQGGTLGIGNNAVAQTLTIGNGTGATSVAVLCGTGACGFGNNAVAHTTTIGSSTGAATTILQGGTGGVTIGNNGVANTIQIGNTTGAVAQTINLGNNATASSTSTVTIGSTVGSSATTIQGGTGSVALSGNSTSTTQSIARILQGGTGDTDLEFYNSGLNKSFFTGMQTSSGNFVINSSTAAATSTTTATPTHVQSNSIDTTSATATTIAQSFTANVTAGNYIVATVMWGIASGGSQTGYTCSDNLGNSYTNLESLTDTPNQQYAGICYAKVTTGGTATVTVTFAGSANPYRALAISEYSNLAATNPVDGYTLNNGAGTTATDGTTTGSIVTTASGDLIYTGVTTTGSASPTLTAGTGFTRRTFSTNATSVASEDKILSSPGTATGTMTEDTSSKYAAFLVAFKPATTTSTGTNTNNFANPILSVTQAGTATFGSSLNAASFLVSGTGVANILQANAFDTASAGTLSIGNVNATTVNIATSPLAARNVTIGSTNGTSGTTIQGGSGGITLVTNSASAGTLVKAATDSPTAFVVQDSLGNSIITADSTSLNVGIGLDGAASDARLYSYVQSGPNAVIRGNTGGNGDLLQLQQSGTNVVDVGATGNTLLKNSTNSTTAFQIQNTVGASFFTADSTNQAITTKQLSVGSPIYTSGARLFSDDLESGTFNHWVGMKNTPGVSGSSSVTIDSTTVHSGNHSMKVVNNNGQAFTSSYFTANSTVDARAYVYLSSATTNARLIYLGDDSDTSYIALMYDQATGKLAVYNSNTSTTTDTSAAFTLGSWHEIELDMTASATTGTITAYLDNASVLSQTNVNTGGNNPYDFEAGDDATNRVFTAYFDDLVVDTVRPGDAASLDVNDSLHVGGFSSFGGEVLIQPASEAYDAFRVQDPNGTAYLSVDTANGNVHIDPDGKANGTMYGALKFGGTGSTEGIGSDRQGSSSNPYGLDFYTNSKQVMRLYNDGSALFQNQTDSGQGFTIQNAGGTTLMNIDTTNKHVCFMMVTCNNAIGLTGKGASTLGWVTSATPDLSEWIPTDGTVEAADVVMADPNNTERVVKATGAYTGAAVGVISDGTSGFQINPYGNIADGSTSNPNARPLVLAGRVPVKVTNEGGAIKPGDYLTVSSTPGYAMKATHAGPTIGKALGFFDGSQASGTVLALINLSYYDPASGTAIQGGDASFSSLNVSGTTSLNNLNVSGTATFSGELDAAMMKVGTMATPTLTGVHLLTDVAEITNVMRVGDATNGVDISGARGVSYRGTARPDNKVTLTPAFPGAVNSSSAGNGTMTTDFCSSSSRLNINAAICAGTNDEHNYYSWTTTQSTPQSSDIYVRYQLPSNFSAFASDAAISLYGWRTAVGDGTELSLYQANGSQCGATTTINSSDTSWQQTPLAGSLSGCAVSAGDMLTLRIHVTASAGQFARVGELQIDYLSKF